MRTINCSGGCIDCAPEEHGIKYYVWHIYPEGYDDCVVKTDSLLTAKTERDRLNKTTITKWDGYYIIVVDMDK